MAVTYTEYPDGMARLARATWLIAHLRDVAEVLAQYAELVTAPIDTGRYAGVGPGAAIKPGGFVVISGVRNGHAWAQVYNHTPYAVYLEFGTRYMARQRPLGRAVEAMRE